MHGLSLNRRALAAVACCWVFTGVLFAGTDVMARPISHEREAPAPARAAPAMTIRYFEVGVSLSREILGQALRAMESDLTTCAMRHATGRSPLIGFELLTMPSGRVDSAGSMGWNHLDDGVGFPALNCMRDVLMAWRFPRATRFGLAAFHISWTLSAADLPTRRPRK